MTEEKDGTSQSEDSDVFELADSVAAWLYELRQSCATDRDVVTLIAHDAKTAESASTNVEASVPPEAAPRYRFAVIRDESSSGSNILEKLKQSTSTKEPPENESSFESEDLENYYEELPERPSVHTNDCEHTSTMGNASGSDSAVGTGSPQQSQSEWNTKGHASLYLNALDECREVEWSVDECRMVECRRT